MSELYRYGCEAKDCLWYVNSGGRRKPRKRNGNALSKKGASLRLHDVCGVLFHADSTRGDSVCTGCGQVLLSRPVDETHDWRNFADSDQDNSRVGLVDPYAGGHMATRFAAGTSKQSQQMAWSHNKVNMDTTTKNMIEANEVIGALGNTLNLTPHIQSKAKELYREYEKNRSSSQRKASCRPLMVAIVYIACNQEGFSRTFKELAKSSGVTEKELRSFIKSVQKVLPHTSTPPSDPSTLVDRFCARLHTDLPEWLKIGASQIAKKAFSTVLEGKQPATVAAGSILLAAMLAGFNLDPDSVAAATQSISGSTVSATCNKLSQHKAEVVPAELLTKIQQFRATNKSALPSSAAATSSSAPIASSSAPAAPSAGTFLPPKPMAIHAAQIVASAPIAKTENAVKVQNAAKPAPLTSVAPVKVAPLN